MVFAPEVVLICIEKGLLNLLVRSVGVRLDTRRLGNFHNDHIRKVIGSEVCLYVLFEFLVVKNQHDLHSELLDRHTQRVCFHLVHRGESVDYGPGSENLGVWWRDALIVCYALKQRFEVFKVVLKFALNCRGKLFNLRLQECVRDYLLGAVEKSDRLVDIIIRGKRVGNDGGTDAAWG